jgi:hypothetical protein
MKSTSEVNLLSDKILLATKFNVSFEEQNDIPIPLSKEKQLSDQLILTTAFPKKQSIN